MRTPGKLRVACVGLGWVTTHRHLPVLRASADYVVSGLVDRAPGRARELAARLGIPHWSEADDLADVEWLDGVDVVTVGTAPMAHGAIIRSALAAGKHVLTEKPFAMSVGEGEELVSLARERGLRIGVVHNFQFARSTQRMLSDLARGQYGDVRGIIAWQLGNPRRRLPTWREELPLGLFYDESPHLLYLIRRLAPGPLEVTGCVVCPGPAGRATPSAVQASYECRTPSGATVPVQLSMSFDSPVSEWHLTVLGEEALGDVDVFRDIYIRLPNDGLHTTRTVFRTSLLATWQHWTQHVSRGALHLTGRLWYGNLEVFSRFARAVRDGADPEGIGPADALDVLRMQWQIVAHARRTGPG